MAYMRNKVILNLAGARKKHETLEGKEYLVVPAVMLTQGVWNGSHGPLFYPDDELAKDPVVWDLKPVVIQHPTLNGEGISACDPKVLEAQKVGFMLRTSHDGRLKTETWIDEPKLKKVNQEVLNKINAGEMVEVSTGLFYDLEKKSGVYNGERFTGIVHNIRPDHLAILPDAEGACSIKDGAGLMRNQDDYQGPMKLPCPSISELSEPMRKNQMQKALKEKYSGITQDGDWGGWVTDVFANYVVWSKDNKLFRLPYTYDDDKINFDGEPEEVERVSEYRSRRQTPIDGTSSPYNINQGFAMATKPATKEQVDYIAKLNSLAQAGKLTINAIHQGAHELIRDAAKHEDTHETDTSKGDSQARSTVGGARKDEVDKMIAGGHAQEDDRKFLTDLPDDHFEKVSKYVMRGATTVIQPYSYEGIKDRSNAHASNQQAAPITEEQYIQQAPPGIREVLSNAMASAKAEKTRTVKLILANKANRFTEAWLMKQELPMLQGLAQLARGAQQQPIHNYSGQGDIPMFNEAGAVVDNSADDFEETLPLPSVFGPENNETKRQQA